MHSALQQKQDPDPVDDDAPVDECYLSLAAGCAVVGNNLQNRDAHDLVSNRETEQDRA